MAYKIRYQRDTKAELDNALSNYGSDFQAEASRWLADLAQEAEAKEHNLSASVPDLSIDFEAILETIQQVNSSPRTSWAYSLRKFRTAAHADSGGDGRNCSSDGASWTG